MDLGSRKREMASEENNCGVGKMDEGGRVEGVAGRRAESPGGEAAGGARKACQ